jgi:L-ascorbate metabolism protein UlaG (beta-lactamase superfamily)
VVKLNHFHKDIRWFVPKGLKDWFTDCKNVIELAWWEESVMNLNDKDDTKVICVPAQHCLKRQDPSGLLYHQTEPIVWHDRSTLFECQTLEVGIVFVCHHN